MTANGFGVLRFDFTGLGESEGDFADTNFSGNVEDLVAAADYLKEDYKAPTLLVGHSLGGAIANRDVGVLQPVPVNALSLSCKNSRKSAKLYSPF